jgi:hypothetical protein
MAVAFGKMAPRKLTNILLFAIILNAYLLYIGYVDWKYVKHTKELDRRESLATLHDTIATSSLVMSKAPSKLQPRRPEHEAQKTEAASDTLGAAILKSAVPEAQPRKLWRERTEEEVEELRERSRIRRTRMINYTRPRLSELISNGTVIGDPQFLLDFVVAGFGKCGTSTMMHWLADHPEVQSFRDEIWELMRSNPAGLIDMLYNSLPPGHYKRGYKSPGEITQAHILEYLAKYWPKTRLVVGLRHPISWFESLYNFRVQNLPEGAVMMKPNQLIGRCNARSNHACTEKGSFSYYLMRLGKTNYNGTGKRGTTELEEEILGRFPRNWYNLSETPYKPNPIFLFELRQLADTNETRSTQFRQDFQSFLGLKQNLPDMVHFKPGQNWDREIQKQKEEKKIKICDEQWIPVRRELLRMARQGSRWIRSVFLDCQDVHVSSRPYLEELLLTWMHDPCGNETNIIRFHGPTVTAPVQQRAR